jgi:hypothetical protein
MNRRFVSLHPYFKAHPGKLDAIKAMLQKFTDKTAAEKAILFYEFSWNGRQTIYFTNWKRLRTECEISMVRSEPKRLSDQWPALQRAGRRLICFLREVERRLATRDRPILTFPLTTAL